LKLKGASIEFDQKNSMKNLQTFCTFVLLIGVLAQASIAGPMNSKFDAVDAQPLKPDRLKPAVADAPTVEFAKLIVSAEHVSWQQNVLFARVSPSSTGTYRDSTSFNNSWNWQSSGVDNFQGLNPQLLQPSLSISDHDLPRWVRVTELDESEGAAFVAVGFWGFSNVAEMPGYPGSNPLIPLPAAAMSGSVGLLLVALKVRKGRV